MEMFLGNAFFDSTYFQVGTLYPVILLQFTKTAYVPTTDLLLRRSCVGCGSFVNVGGGCCVGGCVVSVGRGRFVNGFGIFLDRQGRRD